jgi:hypothetical protein
MTLPIAVSRTWISPTALGRLTSNSTKDGCGNSKRDSLPCNRCLDHLNEGQSLPNILLVLDRIDNLFESNQHYRILSVAIGISLSDHSECVLTSILVCEPTRRLWDEW